MILLWLGGVRSDSSGLVSSGGTLSRLWLLHVGTCLGTHSAMENT